MKLLKVVVDELPSCCGECDFVHDRYYCTLKGLTIGQQFVDRQSKERDSDCPLEEEN